MDDVRSANFGKCCNTPTINMIVIIIKVTITLRLAGGPAHLHMTPMAPPCVTACLNAGKYVSASV